MWTDTDLVIAPDPAVCVHVNIITNRDPAIHADINRTRDIALVPNDDAVSLSGLIPYFEVEYGGWILPARLVQPGSENGGSMQGDQMTTDAPTKPVP